MIMDLDEWVEGLTKNVYEKWKSDYSFWKPGFKVFYSPVREHPDVMIISLNPGGDESSFKREDFGRFENGDFAAPTEHAYVVRKYDMAKKMQKFFVGHDRLLQQSVAFTVLFFRSRDIMEWKKLDKGKRREMENFSYELVKEIIDRVKPKSLLIIGFATYLRLKKHILDKVKNEKSRKGKNVRLSLTAEWNDVPVFCVPHFTGARVTNGDFEKNRKQFFKIIK